MYIYTVIKQEQLDEIVADIADGKKQVDFEQFYAIVTALEGAAEEVYIYKCMYIHVYVYKYIYIYISYIG
jgi:hypothetical protein